jgi:chorismate mutase
MPAAPTVRALRAATTVDADTTDQIAQRVQELLLEVMARNGLATDDVISILFTATADVVATFPATVARDIGFGSVPLICATEINVLGATPRCIRALLHIHTSRPSAELHHVYLHGARGLRDDLPD